MQKNEGSVDEGKKQSTTLLKKYIYILESRIDSQSQIKVNNKTSLRRRKNHESNNSVSNSLNTKDPSGVNISKRYLSNNHNKKPIKGNKASSQRSVRNIQSQVTIIKQQHVLKHKKPPGAIGHLAQSIEAKLCNSQLQVTTVKQQRVLQIGNSEDFAYEPRTLPWCSTEINTQSHRREWKRTAPED